MIGRSVGKGRRRALVNGLKGLGYDMRIKGTMQGLRGRVAPIVVVTKHAKGFRQNVVGFGTMWAKEGESGRK